jgi:3-methyl-2-oxobutanoate hydroxymethyltransferase
LRRKRLIAGDLLSAKGKCQFTENLVEAAACDEAGGNMPVCGAGEAASIRAAAPNAFLTVAVGINNPEVASGLEAIRASFAAMRNGADGIYTGMSIGVVAEMARESIPVIGHVGYIP